MPNYIQIPPDSTGKKVLNFAHITGSDTVYVQGVNIVDYTDPNRGQTIDARGAALTSFAEGAPSLGPFGRLRVGEETVVGSYDYTGGAEAELYYQYSSSVGSVLQYNPTSSTMLLQVDTTSGSRVIQSTNRYHHYQPGNGMLLMTTLVVGDTGKANNIRRWGMFDDRDGVFFELSGSALSAVIRSSVTGVVLERKVSQSQWNLDTLDGAGISSYTLDITTTQIYFIDYAWGLGRVRFGVTDGLGNRVASHIFESSNVLTLPWSAQAEFPIRTENVNVDTTVSTSEIRHVCAVVYAESRVDPTYWQYGNFNVKNKGITTGTPVMSIRPKLTYNGKTNRSNAWPDVVSVYVSGGPMLLEAVTTPSLSGATFDFSSTGPLEADVSASSYTLGSNGYVVYSRMLGTGTHELDIPFEDNDEGLVLGGDGVTQPIYSLVGTSLGSPNATCSLALNYRELS